MDEKRSEVMKKYWRRIRLMNYALMYIVPILFVIIILLKG